MNKKRDWQPLHVALAWIISRNEADAEAVASDPKAKFNIFQLFRWIPKRDESGERLFDDEPLFDDERPFSLHDQDAISQQDLDAFLEKLQTAPEQISSHEAWELLRDAVCDGKVSMRAKWVDRRILIDRSGEGADIDWQETNAPTASDVEPASMEGYELWQNTPRGDGWLAPRDAPIMNEQGRFWTDPMVNWGELQNDFPPTVGSKSKGLKRGPSEKFNWQWLKSFMFQLLDELGPLDSEIPDWDSKEDIYRKLTDGYAKEFERENGPERSTLQPKVEEWIKEWEAGQEEQRKTAGN